MTIREACILARSTQPAMRAAACRVISAVVLAVHPNSRQARHAEVLQVPSQQQEVSCFLSIMLMGRLHCSHA